MATPLKVVGIGGSLSARSTSLAALRTALEGAAEAGADTETIDIASLDLPFYDPAAPAPDHAITFAETVAAADALVWSSPMYHGTVSGSFKNALDWLQLLAKHDPPYLTGKVVGLIATAGGVQGLQAINTMEFVVRALRGWTVPLVVPVARAWAVFDDAGATTDVQVERQLRQLGAEVARAARSLRPEMPLAKAV